MKLCTGRNYLITTDAWFFAPDGNTYRSVFGKVTAIQTDAEVLGLKTNAKSTNWYIVVGNMIIAGCQIHYVIQTEECRFEGCGQEKTDANGKICFQTGINRIYNANKKLRQRRKKPAR